MEIFNRKLPSFETLGRVLSNLALPEESKQPLAMAYYFTFDCNASCWFCSQKDQINQVPNVDLAEQFETLRVVREGCPNIYLMGGEPTMSPDLGVILSECEVLGFDTIAVNTNALKYSPEILEHANMLVVSLSSMNPKDVGDNFGLSEIDGQRAINNIRKYAQERDPSSTQMVVNAVVTGDNIDDIYRVANYCSDLGILLNIAPAIMPNGRPDKRLVGNLEYQRLIDDLKADRRLMACTQGYLDTIRDFDDFVCTPNVIPGVYPSGDMVVPCPSVNEPAMVNLNEVGDVREALRIGREQFGNFDTTEECASLCHKTCYVEGAQLNSPVAVLDLIKNLFKRRLRPWEVVYEEDSDQEVDEEMDRILQFLAQYCDDLHAYDFLIHRNIWDKKHVEFSENLGEFSVEELELMEKFMEDVSFSIEKYWEIGSGDLQKMIMAIGHLSNRIIVNPFIGFFRFAEKLTKIGLISGLGGENALNRLNNYRNRIRTEIYSRQKVEAEACV